MPVKNYFLIAIICSVIASCDFHHTKFTTRNEFTGDRKLSNVFLIVVSDKDTKSCLNYYKEYLLDSLKAYGINGDGTFSCCRDKHTDMREMLDSSLSSAGTYQNILTVVISKTIVGHGTSSARELQLNLFDVFKQQTTWSGTLRSDFNWFISDENYMAVAKSLAHATLAELRNKAIL